MPWPVLKKRKKSQYLIDRISKRSLPEKFADTLLDLELEVETNPTNVKAFKQLMELYAQGIEYYSSVGNPRYKTLTDRMQKLYMNPRINAALDTKVRPSSPGSLKGSQLQTRPNRFGLAQGTPYRNTIAHFAASDTTATTAIESQIEEEEKLVPGITEEEDILRLESQLSKISMNSYKEDQEVEKEKESPRFMMQGAFMDYVTKRDNLKLDLDKQESNFNMRLLKRRMTSANRSCNRSRSSFSQQRSPKAAAEKSLKSVTSFTNLFFGHRHTPYREKIDRGRSLKVPDTEGVSRSLEVEDKPLENLSISIKDITFVTEETRDRNIVQEKDEFSDSNFSLDSVNNEAPQPNDDVSWLSSEIEKNHSVEISELIDLKEDAPGFELLLSEKKQSLAVEEEEKKPNLLSPRLGPFHPNRPQIATESPLHKKAIRNSMQCRINQKSSDGKSRGFRASERIERKKRMSERDH